MLSLALLLLSSVRASAGPATRPTTQPDGGGRSLFDGKTLGNWKVSDYAGHGEVTVEDGTIVLSNGERLTGIAWDGGKLPKTNYEITLDAKKINGSDFFCGLTFPVGDSFASLILGGWGGTVVGISSLDGEDAAHNDTTSNHKFELNKWYHIRLRVEPERLLAWVDDQKVVDVSIKGKKVNVRVDIEESKPLGIATFQTSAAVKGIEVRVLGDKP